MIAMLYYLSCAADSFQSEFLESVASTTCLTSRRATVLASRLAPTLGVL